MSDKVNHPEHYQCATFECIDVMKEILTPEQMKGFCLGNAFKYVWRAGKKEGFKQDICKAIFYLDYIVNELEDDAE